MSITQHLKKVDLFKNLSVEELKKVEKIATRHGIRADSLLFEEGSKGDQIFIILVGSVKILTQKDGKESILTILKEGDNFGELALIDAQPRSASAKTIGDSVLLSIGREPFLNLLKDHFSITKKILEVLSSRLRITNNHVTDLVFNDAKANIVKSLITLCQQHGTRENDVIEIKTGINKTDLGNMANTSDEIANLVLQDLEAKQIVYFKHPSIFINVLNLVKYQRGSK